MCVCVEEAKVGKKHQGIEMNFYRNFGQFSFYTVPLFTIFGSTFCQVLTRNQLNVNPSHYIPNLVHSFAITLKQRQLQID